VVEVRVRDEEEHTLHVRESSIEPDGARERDQAKSTVENEQILSRQKRVAGRVVSDLRPWRKVTLRPPASPHVEADRAHAAARTTLAGSDCFLRSSHSSDFADERKGRILISPLLSRAYIVSMRETLIDLTRHCIWSDHELWSSAESCPGALDDSTLLERFHHIHLVQYAFVSLVQGDEVDVNRGEKLSATELREWGRSNAVTLFELASKIPDEELAEHFSVPWFKEPPIELSRGEAILQACLHSVHHRAQNATRLRELGAEPPTIDYIVWIWKGRPA